MDYIMLQLTQMCSWIVLVLVIFSTNIPEMTSQEVIQIACNLTERNESCPDNFCCVRDEYLFTETYCRQYGQAGSNCGTRESEFECPCETGYKCASNIHGHITSLFGKCYPIGGTTSASPNAVTTTTGYSMTSSSTSDGPTRYSDGGTIVGK